MFGLLIGGIGIASAGVGIGIPMIPLGVYLIVRGIRSFFHEKQQEETGTYEKQPIFERTRAGRIGLGIILILVGIATSALLIGIPLIIIGLVLVGSALKFDSGEPEEPSDVSTTASDSYETDASTTPTQPQRPQPPPPLQPLPKGSPTKRCRNPSCNRILLCHWKTCPHCKTDQ